MSRLGLLPAPNRELDTDSTNPVCHATNRCARSVIYAEILFAIGEQVRVQRYLHKPKCCVKDSMAARNRNRRRQV